jgi:hypothetical protein
MLFSQLIAFVIILINIDMAKWTQYMYTNAIIGCNTKSAELDQPEHSIQPQFIVNKYSTVLSNVQTKTSKEKTEVLPQPSV